LEKGKLSEPKSKKPYAEFGLLILKKASYLGGNIQRSERWFINPHRV
jgi:hypothetical protein